MEEEKIRDELSLHLDGKWAEDTELLRDLHTVFIVKPSSLFSGSKSVGHHAMYVSILVFPLTSASGSNLHFALTIIHPLFLFYFLKLDHVL